DYPLAYIGGVSERSPLAAPAVLGPQEHARLAQHEPLGVDVCPNVIAAGDDQPQGPVDVYEPFERLLETAAPGIGRLKLGGNVAGRRQRRRRPPVGRFVGAAWGSQADAGQLHFVTPAGHRRVTDVVRPDPIVVVLRCLQREQPRVGLFIDVRHDSSSSICCSPFRSRSMSFGGGGITGSRTTMVCSGPSEPTRAGLGGSSQWMRRTR